MKTVYPLVLILAMAMAGVMLSMSGFNEEVGTNKHSSSLTDEFESVAGNVSVNQEDPGIVGSVATMLTLVVTAVSQLFNIIVFLLLLPLELRGLGFPGFFAYPIGLSVQILGSIGILQFAAGRMLR